MRVPALGELRSRAASRTLQRVGRPLRVARVEKRQVEQPFAGVIDDVEGQRALARRASRRLIRDDQPQFAGTARRFRPAAIFEQRLEVGFVIEPRHRIVGLRLQPRACDAALRHRLEYRQPSAVNEVVHERGDENRFARARQAGDAEPQRRIEETRAIVRERPRGDACFFGDIGDESHGLCAIRASVRADT